MDNVKGVFFLTQKLLPLLEVAKNVEDPSRVINIGSIDGLQTPAFETFLLSFQGSHPPPHESEGPI